MNIYTFYTNSHREIYEEYFLKSFNKYNRGNLNLFVRVFSQKTEDGSWSDPNFGECMGDKLTLISEALSLNEGEWFVYADCDIQFFGDIEKDLLSHIEEEMDIICQEDDGTICAGFMAIKSSEKTRSFFNFISEQRYGSLHDQGIINNHNDRINFKFLPKERYYTVGNFNGCRVWNPGDVVDVPNNILLHHSNFTIGTQNKIKLLDLVKKSVEEKKLKYN